MNVPPDTHPEVKAKYLRSNFPEKHLNTTIQELEGHKSWLANTKAARVKLAESKVLCIFGGPRTGKTQMATTIARTEMLHQGVSAHYDFAMQFILDFEQRDRLWEVIDDKYHNPVLLVLDQLHHMHQTPMHHAWMDNLLNRRLNEGLKTIFIAEAAPRTIRSFLPQGVAGACDRTKSFLECNWAPIN